MYSNEATLLIEYLEQHGLQLYTYDHQLENGDICKRVITGLEIMITNIDTNQIYGICIRYPGDSNECYCIYPLSKPFIHSIQPQVTILTNIKEKVILNRDKAINMLRNYHCDAVFQIDEETGVVTCDVECLDASCKKCN